MLPDSFKADVLDIISIARQCPEPLQERCLELLLQHYLNATEGRPRQGTDARVPPIMDSDGADEDANLPDEGSTSDANGDLSAGDLHVKAKRFMEKYKRTLDDLNNLFYKEGSDIKPLYEDLKTTKASESQLRIALMHALLRGIRSGEFQFDGEEVRSECQVRKTYDPANFATNFKNNAVLFELFEKYDRNAPVIRLAEAGRARLADLIVELQ